MISSLTLGQIVKISRWLLISYFVVSAGGALEVYAESSQAKPAAVDVRQSHHTIVNRSISMLLPWRKEKIAQAETRQNKSEPVDEIANLEVSQGKDKRKRFLATFYKPVERLKQPLLD